jgi:hypothetical protein
MRGREEVVVISVEEYRRIKGEPTGQVLIDAMQDPRVRGLRFERESVRSPIRDVEL